MQGKGHAKKGHDGEPSRIVGRQSTMAILYSRAFFYSLNRNDALLFYGTLYYSIIPLPLE